MAKNINIKVKADDQASGTLNKISGNINGFTKKVNSATQPLTNLGKSLTGLTKAIPGIGLVTAAVAGVGKAVSETVKSMKEWELAFAEVEKSVKRIDFAAKLNSELGASSRALQNFTSELSASLNNIYSGGELNNVVSSLAFDKTAEQIKQIVTVATDLSAAMGTDLNTAVSQLNQTFSGTTGQLGKIFPELKTLSKEALAAGDAVALISEKVKGMAKEMTNSVNGSLLRSKNLSGDLKEELGYWVKDFFNPIREQISDIKEKWRDALASRRTLKEAKEAYANKTATVDDFNVLIDDLKTKRANEVVNKKSREAAGFGTAESEAEILRLSQQINSYEQQKRWLQNSIGTSKTAPVSANANTTTPATESTPFNPRNFKGSGVALGVQTVAQYKEMLVAQAQANAQAMQSYTDHIREQEDQYVEMMIAKRKAREEEEQKQKQEKANRWSTYGGEVGAYVSAGITGGPMGVISMALQALVQKLQENSGIINALFNSVTTFFDIVIKPLVDILEPMLNPVLAIIQSQAGIVAGLMSLLQPFTDIITPIMETIGGVVYWIQKFLTNIIDYMKWGYTEFVNWIIEIYNAIVTKRWEKDPRAQEKSLEEINSAMKRLFNGDFINDYKAILSANQQLSPAASTSGSATYNAVRDINIYISYDRSYINGDAQDIAIDLERQIQKAYRMNLI